MSYTKSAAQRSLPSHISIRIFMLPSSQRSQSLRRVQTLGGKRQLRYRGAVSDNLCPPYGINRLRHGPYTTKTMARGPDRILSKNARIEIRHRVEQMHALRRWHEHYQSVRNTRLSRHFISDVSSESWKNTS